MSFLSKWRPYILISLFLSFLLSTVVLFSGNRTEAAVPSTAVQPVPGISLTQGVRKTVLDNGLTVLTKEVHTAPVVSVQVWYRVGSRNEPVGVNGISHQLEHLLFKGTTDRPIQFGRLFSALGSQFNAFTSYDETAYFGTVSQDKLEALLTLEADRMQNSLNGPEQLTSEKRVVISELQGYENGPGYRLSRAVMRAAFPDRAYGLPVGGTKADVEKFTVEQVRSYYQTYYSPDNATLVIAGDFTTDTVLKSIQQTFGQVPKRAKTAPTPTQAAATHETSPVQEPTAKKPIVLKQPGSAALLQMVYPLPDVNSPDVPAIDVMDAILSGGRSSRLYQGLVESGLASSASAYAAELIEPGWYTISATAAPGQELAKIDQVLQQTLANLQQKGVSKEELNRAKTQMQAAFILGNQDITSQASQLGYNQTVTGDYRYSDRYLSAIIKVTAADVQRVAKTYLNPAKQTVGFFEPTLPDGKPGSSSAGAGRTVENFSPGAPVDPAEVAKYLPPATAKTAATTQPLPEQLTLANGLRVLLLPDHSSPTINLSGQIEAGTAFDTKQKAGTASLTAANLMNGTRTKNALALAKALEDRGVSLGFGAAREGVSVSGNALAADLPVLMKTLADVLQNAQFPDEQLQLSRQRNLTALKLELDDPGRLARRVFQQTIYPENHPFHNFPTEDSLKSITRADLVRFYQQHYRPDTTILALVGDFNPASVRSLFEQSLGKWQAKGKRPVLNFPTVSLPKAATRKSEVIPGKAEAVTFIGYGGISRQDPRFYTALILNEILGGSTLSSRLGTEVRDRQGLTYGIYSAFQAGLHPGPFLISMQTAPSDASKAVASTLALLRQLREQGVTAAELSSAKRSITNSYPVDLANPGDLADVILSNAVYGLNREEIRSFPKRIEAVSLAQMQQAIQELIHPDNLVIVTAGPGNTTPKGG